MDIFQTYKQHYRENINSVPIYQPKIDSIQTQQINNIQGRIFSNHYIQVQNVHTKTNNTKQISGTYISFLNLAICVCDG